MPPKVFLSYSHDSAEHKDRVLALCDRLRADGIEAWIDQYETSPPEGWPRWCANRVEEEDFVLAVCTETYERRFRGAEELGRGLGGQWEGFVIYQELYEAAARNTKIIPVFFTPIPLEYLPKVLRSVSRYDVSGDEGYWHLVRHLTGQLETPAPPLGSPVALPPKERRTVRFTIAPEPKYEDDRSRRLGEELTAARLQFKELTIAGEGTEDVREQILQIRREMRDGGLLQPGDCLGDGRFQLLEIIGRGGFATVWKAWDEEKQELVAVKVLHGQHAQDRSRRERFFRGARKMAELHHPGIVRVLVEHLEEGGHHAFVMEYVGGGDLRAAILSGRLPQDRVLPLILNVGEALAFAHERGLIHRDVKPANVLLDGDLPKLTDFDLVRAFDSTGGTQTQGHFGTFLYTAPEVHTNAKDAGPAADIYSLAMTALFAFYGSDLPPDVWRQPEVFVDKVPCPVPVREVLRRGIAWESGDRPASVADLCRDLSRPAAVPVPVRLRESKPRAGRFHRTDGTELVYVPGGEYVLGANDVNEEASPIHQVVLSPFWIAKYPVTNEQYSRFLKENPKNQKPRYWDAERFNQPQHPVVGVSWGEAKAYCAWAGLQLPSEAQWEAAARGADQRRFAWGNEEPTIEHANFENRESGTTPVGAFPKGAGPFGTLDQAGNIWEWCEDLWEGEAYKGRDGERDPVISGRASLLHCLRGGGWGDPARGLAAAYRLGNPASHRLSSIGFRCLLPAHPE